MHCVAVTSSLPGREFQAPLAFIRDFTELSVKRLRELFAGVGEAPRAK